MAQRTEHNGRRRTDIKGPLIISAVLAVVAFVVVSVVAAGGTDNAARVGLGLIAAGIAFIASVVVCATLMMIEKPNDPSLGEGTGVNRSSAKLYAQRRATREQKAAREAQKDSEDSRKKPGDEDGGPQFGQRVHPEQ